MSTKSPAMVLQELGVKNGITPKYVDVPVEARPQHDPLYRVQCTLIFKGNTYIAIGEASTKKGAKQKVCEKMIQEELKDVLDLTDPDIRKVLGVMDTREEALISSSSEPAIKQRKMSGPEDDPVLDVDTLSDYAAKGNPIVDLDVLCEKYGLPEAEYQDGPKCGPPHRPFLSIECTLEEVTTRGVYYDKKKAKRIAAEKMVASVRQKIADGKLKLKNDEEQESISVQMDAEETLKLESFMGQSEFTRDKLKFNPNKTLDTFMQRPYLETLRENGYSKIVKNGGACVKEMLVFADEINRQFRLGADVYPRFYEWLSTHENGISGFYLALEKELAMESQWIGLEDQMRSGDATDQMDTDRGDKPPYCMFLTVTIPGIERAPVHRGLSHNVEDAKNEAMVRVIMHLALMAAELPISKVI